MILLLNSFLLFNSLAQTLPLVYDVENTGADCPIPYLPSFSELPIIQPLTDPFMWSDGRGRISNYSDWRYRRAEIKAEIENYEIGEKPVRPDSISASYANGTLTVNVTVNGQTLTLTSAITLPEEGGPFPAIITITPILPADTFISRGIAIIQFNFGQVMAWQQIRGSEPINKLYPDLIYMGAYSAWSWGVSRLIDGLELVQADLPIDLKHLGVTGCSFAGKMALFAGALDERIALTIAQESGGGGYTTWRYSEVITDNVETLRNTSHVWFIEDLFIFSNAVPKLPYDHHELMAMVAPRALFLTGNPGWVWLADESGYVGSKAVQKVYDALGVSDRFGYSQIGGHDHCVVPTAQIPEIEAFVDKFLLGDTTANTDVSTSPYNTDLSPWITWTAPTLLTDSSYFGKASLTYPSDFQTGVDTSVTFQWNKVEDAEKYFIQISLNAVFTNIVKNDSTADTVITFNGLLPGKAYYWRIQTKSTDGLLGPWSNLGHFSTTIALPAKPELGTVTPYPNRPLWFTFNWKKVQYADQYLIQVSNVETFTSIFTSASTPDTLKVLYGFLEGQTYYWRVQASNVSGVGPWSEVSSFVATVTDVKYEDEQKIPTDYSVSQNYPNPFNPTTKIKFGIPASANPTEGGALVTLKIYDMLGHEVKTLINEELKPGYYSIDFNSLTLGGLPSGVYFYKIRSGDFIQTKKMVLLK